MTRPAVRYRVLDGETPYTGRELRPGWVSERTGLAGDAAAGFVGPCRVATEDLVDLEDAAAGETIVAARMAHVVVEHPGCPLETAVWRQRMLVCLLCGALAERGVATRREGDDVYVDARKLTVSIAAPSAGGSLIHLGVNVDPAGAPVPAVGLAELGVDPAELLETLLARYAAEVASVRHAVTKVRTVE